MSVATAKVILDSIGRYAPRLTTLQLRYPRIIHSELMTHRVFSRNARSSRAVPIEKMLEEVINDPFIPVHWGAAQPGMQAYEECDNTVITKFQYGPHIENPQQPTWSYVSDREHAWLHARDHAVASARAFMQAGYAKQLVNRLIEPFTFIDVLVTATEYSNFLALRDHPAAEPHIRLLAQAMKQALAESTPQEIRWGMWHLPYITAEERDTHSTDALKLVSVARCARISYTPYSGESGDIAKEIDRADMLAKSGHWSPFEHQARTRVRQDNSRGNLEGWVQFRKVFANEDDFSRIGVA